MERLLLASMLLVACGPSNEGPADGGSTDTAYHRVASGRYTGAVALPGEEERDDDLTLWPGGACAVIRTVHAVLEGGNQFLEWGRWDQQADGVVRTYFPSVTEQYTVDGEGALHLDRRDPDGPSMGVLLPVKGLTLPKGDAELEGTFHYTARHVAHYRECDSGKDFLVRLDPEAAGIEGEVRDLGRADERGVVVNVRGSLRPTSLSDEDGPVILLTIRSYDDPRPEEQCPY